MIDVRGLRKSFTTRRGRVDAVNGVDLDVAAGEIFGFLGPNGAGKTTTLRMLATLVPPDGGTATIAGADLRTEPGEVRRRIGYVAQGGGTWGESTAREELILQARLYGVSRRDARGRAAVLLGAFRLDEYADRKCRTYSGGQRRRVDVALGVIHAPKVVFLDEPTAGLDPQSRAHLWDEIRRLRDEGTTVFVTTHYLDEADALCDRIAIMDHGEIVASGSPAELKRSISGDTILLTGVAPSDALRAYRHEPYDGGVRVYVEDGPAALPRLLHTLDAAGIPVGPVELHRPSLDDVFLTKTGRSLRES